MKLPTRCMLLALAGAAAAAHAEIATDGSLGPARNLAGPDYAIGADLGRQAGANLFHSFRHFSIGQGESATFSGPASVRNVIGRVTGGQSSLIDGVLRSTIPNADLYLLNPAGVLVGEHASLDVGGSLYLSSADQLNLADGGRFSATDPGNAVLSVAAPASFGFVSPHPAPVGVEGAQLELDGGGITLVGGDLNLTRGAGLDTGGGPITLSAVAAPTDVALNGAPVDQAAGGGAVRLVDGARLDAGGPAGGRIFVRGGNILLQDGVILSHTRDAAPGHGVHLQGAESIDLAGDSVIQSAALGSADAGPVTLEAPRVDIRDGSGLMNSSFGGGTGGITRIVARRLALSDAAAIYNEARDSGAGGRILIQVGDLLMQGKALISGRSFTTAPGSDIEIEATGSVRVRGELDGNSKPFMLAATALDQGAAGNIRINAGELLFEDVVLDVSTEGSGAAGIVDLIIAGRMYSRNGAFQSASKNRGPGGLLRVRAGSFEATGNGGLLALGIHSGPGGSIDVEAARIELSDGAEFSNETFYGAFGTGTIRVKAGESLVIRGREEPDPYPAGSVPGAGRVSTGIFSYTGDVTVSAPDILVEDSGQIAARTQNDLPAGRLSVSGERIRLLNGGQISGDSIGSSFWLGGAGHIVVSASESILISGETGDRYSGVSGSSRSSGDAGLIELAAPLVVIEQGARVNTSTGVFTDNSAGGIRIRSDRLFIRDDGGIVSASVGHAGEGGDIELRATESVEVSGDSFISAWGGREGHSGRVLIEAPAVLLRDGKIETTNVGTQKAGDILILTDHMQLLDGSSVRSNTTASGDAGTVSILARRLLEARDSEVSTEALAASGGNIQLLAGTIRLHATPVTGTVAGGAGDGGNVTLGAAAIAATGDSDITARADQGLGGRILVNADVFLRDASIDLDASSNVAGNEGVVEVNAPELDVSAGIKELPADYLDAAGLLKSKCAARSSADRGTLVVAGMDSVPPGPEGYLLDMPVASEEAESPDEYPGAMGPAGMGTWLAGGCSVR